MAIENIYGTWFWAMSSGSFSHTVTVGIPTRTVTAQAALTEIIGNGQAAAFVNGWCTMSSPGLQLCGIQADAPLVGLTNATQVTFEVHVNNMFAKAIGMVFIHS
jgi:hypothetical protein